MLSRTACTLTPLTARSGMSIENIMATVMTLEDSSANQIWRLSPKSRSDGSKLKSRILVELYLLISTRVLCYRYPLQVMLPQFCIGRYNCTAF
jgi:hypothetical protein